jgi:tRNA(Ile)-lysidine synthase TilS/MesJ
MEAETVPRVEGKCRICGWRGPVLRITEFNLKLCAACYPRFFERRIRRAVEKYGMIAEGEKAVVALSGGKDSAALLFALRRLSVVMGFGLAAVHFHLNMGDFSDRNLEVVERQAEKAGVELHVTRIGDMGLKIKKVKAWQPCAVCGAVKRALMNREARRLGAQVVVTAHTLEDMLLFAFKNLLSRKFYIPPPVLDPLDGIPRKVKPLMFTPERLNRAYCELREVPYFPEKCPVWSPKGHALKEAFEVMEEKVPSSKLQLLLSLMEAFPPQEEYQWRPTGPCPRCGEPTSQPLCPLCLLAEWFSSPGETSGRR